MVVAAREAMPLEGRTILITRTEEGNAAERAKLESLGAKVIEFPTIQICPPSSYDDLDAAIENVEKFDWIFFTSAMGVKWFFARLKESDKENFLKNAKFACVGPSTKLELERRGFSVAFVPSTFLTTKLGEEAVQSFSLSGKRVLLARAEHANNEVVNILKRAGAIIKEVAVYKTEPKTRTGQEEIPAGVTDITLTSPSTVEGLLSCLKNVNEISSRNIKVYCIGPVTAKKARELGLNVYSSAQVHTIEGIATDLVSGKEGAT